MIRAALIATVLAGCYSPGVDRCLYRCTSDRGCPSNLTCNAENWCANGNRDSCGETIDAAIDARPDSACGWVTSNIDVCVHLFNDNTTPWTIDTPTSVDTDIEIITPPLPSGVTMQRLQQMSGGDALVISAGDVDVKAILTVRGATPLIIFSNGVTVITSDIIVTPAPVSSASSAACDGLVGVPLQSQKGGGGGGGGSLGGPGANGGPGGKASGAAQAGGRFGTPPTQVLLTPLAGGCRGGDGGSSTMTGGMAGGAIQISARTRIRITSGTVQANGGGGLAGSAASGQGGGGGGGSGGGMLLESAEIKLMLAKLCANGGGGGGSQPGGEGLMSNCTNAAAGGGGTGLANIGGNGATALSGAVDGRPGLGTPTPAQGGGGGGGGLGRIRLDTDLLDTGQSTISPAYTK